MFMNEDLGRAQKMQSIGRGTSRFTFWITYISFSFVQWTGVWASCLTNKKMIRLAQGKQNMRATCYKGKWNSQDCFELWTGGWILKISGVGNHSLLCSRY